VSTGVVPGTSASVLGASAADEWAALVATAVLGTDRRLPPPPLPGWEAWGRATDPAVAVLDRSVAVVAARRAGACAVPVPAGVLPTAPPDPRPPCPPPCGVRLARILAGEHDVLLPEWLALVEGLGLQLPWASLPTLLLRARRNPRMDEVVRRLARGRATWLADAVPELGVSVKGLVPKPDAPAFAPPPRVPDSGAVVSSIVTLFLDGQATWATDGQLRLLVAALDPSWLPSLVVELSRLAFHTPSERTRADVVALAEFRLEMHREFDPTPDPPPPDPTPDRPSSTGDHA
jgi:hypothetical protein